MFTFAAVGSAMGTGFEPARTDMVELEMLLALRGLDLEIRGRHTWRTWRIAHIDVGHGCVGWSEA